MHDERDTRKTQVTQNIHVHYMAISPPSITSLNPFPIGSECHNLRRGYNEHNNKCIQLNSLYCESTEKNIMCSTWQIQPRPRTWNPDQGHEFRNLVRGFHDNIIMHLVCPRYIKEHRKIFVMIQYKFTIWPNSRALTPGQRAINFTIYIESFMDIIIIHSIYLSLLWE